MLAAQNERKKCWQFMAPSRLAFIKKFDRLNSDFSC